MKILRTKTKIYEWKAKDNLPCATLFVYTFYNRSDECIVPVYTGDIFGKGFDDCEVWKAKELREHYEISNIWQLDNAKLIPA